MHFLWVFMLVQEISKICQNATFRTETSGVINQKVTFVSQKGKRPNVNVKQSLLQAWTGPEGSRSSRLPDNRHKKVIRLSALRTDRLYPPGNIPGTHLCWRLSRSQGHNEVGRIMSTNSSNGTIWNRTRDLPKRVANV